MKLAQPVIKKQAKTTTTSRKTRYTPHAKKQQDSQLKARRAVPDNEEQLLPEGAFNTYERLENLSSILVNEKQQKTVKTEQVTPAIMMTKLNDLS